MTERMRPLSVDGRMVHQLGLPWHWGFGGGSTGDSVNDLAAIATDPNVSIQESKAFTCDVRPGRREGPTTAPLAGIRSGRRVAPNEDDPPVEQPKRDGEA